MEFFDSFLPKLAVHKRFLVESASYGSIYPTCLNPLGKTYMVGRQELQKKGWELSDLFWQKMQIGFLHVILHKLSCRGSHSLISLLSRLFLYCPNLKSAGIVHLVTTNHPHTRAMIESKFSRIATNGLCWFHIWDFQIDTDFSVYSCGTAKWEV
jgi:hypothetical protein